MSEFEADNDLREDWAPAGTRKARMLRCLQWRVQLNQMHGAAWHVAMEARTANVIELARTVTRLSILMRELVDVLAQEAGDAVSERPEAAMRLDPGELAEGVLARAEARVPALRAAVECDITAQVKGRGGETVFETEISRLRAPASLRDAPVK